MFNALTKWKSRGSGTEMEGEFYLLIYMSFETIFTHSNYLHLLLT